MGIMREKLCVLLLIHTSNLSSCKWNHYFLISYERLLSPLAPFPRSSVRTLKVCLGWDGGELPCASTHIFLGITESKREALPAIAPVSNASLQQTKCTNASRTLSGLYCMSHRPFHLHPAPEGHRGHLEWGRQSAGFPQKSLHCSLNSRLCFSPWWFLSAASSRHRDVRMQPYCTLVINEISADLICFSLPTAYSTLPIRKSEGKH